MADSISQAASNLALNAIAGGYTFVQLHTGAPGAAGTTNIASNSTRKAVTWATSTVNSLVSSADAAWTAVPTTEAYTHFSAWSLVSGGTFGFSGAVTNGSVTAGNDFKIASGSLTNSFTLAS